MKIHSHNTLTHRISDQLNNIEHVFVEKGNYTLFVIWWRHSSVNTIKL